MIQAQLPWGDRLITVTCAKCQGKGQIYRWATAKKLNGSSVTGGSWDVCPECLGKKRVRVPEDANLRRA